MKKSKVNQDKIIIEEATCQELLTSAHQELQEWIKSITKKIKALDQKGGAQMLNLDKRSLVQAYLGFLADYHNHDIFDIDSPYSAGLDAGFKEQKTLKSIFLASELLTKMSRQLNLVVTISEKMASELSSLQKQVVEGVIQPLIIYSKGYISANPQISISLKEIGRSPKGDLRYYYSEISDKHYAIYSIGHQKFPSFNLKLNQVDHFKVILSLQLETIIKISEDWEKYQILKDSIESLNLQKECDVKLSYKAKQLTVNEGCKPKKKVQYFSWKSISLSNQLVRKYHAQPIAHLKCSQFQSEEFIFQYNLQLFHRLNMLYSRKEKNDNTAQSQIDYKRVKRFVEILQGMPNFKFKLTKQQKAVISSSGNPIVIGRSGTGKTLVCMLRLYGIENSRLIRQREGNYQFSCQHISKSQKPKNMFLTASSLLIEEVMKQYRDMHYNLFKEHIEKCELCKEHSYENQFYRMDLDAILDRIERRENIRSPISQISIQQFPEFFTVKSLLNILDSGLQRPFFDHDQTKRLKGTAESVINVYWQGYYWVYGFFQNSLNILFKNRLKYYSKLELKNGEQKDKNLSFIQIDYEIFADNIWREISEHYFKVIKKKKSSLNASVVWAEINSIIKGSARAHVTHLKCLSPQQYLEQSRSNYLTLEDKIDIYHIFQEYQKYKNRNKAYDQMDVVNHILQQIMLGRYADQKLDYVFIDEVQDLTPATIYLITIMTKKDIFYCGDTAQAISKGVTFKFSEIKSLFSKKYFQKAVEKEISNELQHLTVNFRSHNRILQLANTVVSMVVQLFPKEIDVLQEERSDLFGPRPLLINNGDQRMIYDLLLSDPSSRLSPAEQERINKIISKEIAAKSQASKNKQKMMEDHFQYVKKARGLMSRHLSTSQVILVRSKKEIEELPCFMKKQFKLTCQQVKGLQYQDVVIYKFFQSSPCLDKWGLLDYLDIEPKFIDESTFQAKISRRAVEEGRQDEEDVPAPLDFISKIQLGYDRDRKMYKVLQLSRNRNYQKIDIKDFHEICSELKLFYTLLTRAKNTVIIFDLKVPRQLIKLLRELEVVNIINLSQISEERQNIKAYKNREINVRYQNKEKLWNEEGIRQLVRKNYDQAINCFEKAQNPRGVKRAQAEKIIQLTKYELYQIDNQLNNPQKLSRQEFKMKKIKLVRRQEQLHAQLLQAAVLFQAIEMYQKAGQIYAKTKNFEGAVKCFKYTKNYAGVADAYYELKNYKQAVNYYYKTKNISRIVQCYLKQQRWRQALQIIKESEDLIKFQIVNNPEMKNQIKQSLSQIMNSIMQDDTAIKNQQQFNKSFFIKQSFDKQNTLRQTLISNNQKYKKARLQNIVYQYNFTILKKILAEVLEKNKQLNQYQKKIQQLSQQRISIIRQTQTLQQRLDQVKKELQIMFGKIKNEKLKLQEIEFLRNKIGTPYYEQRILRQQKQELIRQIVQKDQDLELITQSEEYYQQKISQITENYCSSQRFILIIERISQYLKRQKQLPALPAIVSKLTDVVATIQFYHPTSTSLYFTYLNNHTIRSILKKAERIQAVAFTLIRNHQKEIFPFFDHRSYRQKIQQQLCSGNQQIKEGLTLYGTLQMLNCVQIRYILCEKYLLRFHLHELILEDILRTSKNFHQKRRVKEVLKIIGSDQTNHSIQQDNKKKLDKLTMLATTASFTQHITKQIKHNEPLLYNLRLGLILQGYYQNSLTLCSEEQKLRMLHLYMDYDMLLRQAIRKAKDTNMRLKKQMKYLFFNPKDIGEGTVYHLINTFCIQKIYFDFDQCQSSPILGKPYSIEDIQLSDQQIQECSKQVDKNISQNKKRMLNIDLEIKKKRQQEKDFINKQNQQIKQIRWEIRQRKDKIQKIKKNVQEFDSQIKYYQATTKTEQKAIKTARQNLNQIASNKRRHERIIQDLQKQLSKIKSTNLKQEEQTKQKKQLIKTTQEQLDKIIRDERDLAKIVEQKQKVLKLHNNKWEKLKHDKKEMELKSNNQNSQIQQLYQRIQINSKKKQLFLQNQQAEIKKLTQFKKRWQSREHDQDNERQVNRQVIQRKKKEIVSALNQEKKQQIIQNIQKSSNLQQIKQFQLLHRLITKKIDIDDIVKDKQSSQQLIRVFNLAKEIGKKALKPHQMCMIAISYLNFLFNQEFRKLCLSFCDNIMTMAQQKWYQKEDYKRQKAILENIISNSQYKLKLTTKRQQQAQKDPLKSKNLCQLQQQERYFTKRLQKATNQYNLLIRTAQDQGIALLSVQPITHIHKLLSLYQILKNVSDKNYAFLQIFLGFFQCRVITDCEPLSFLEGQYAFVASDSIVLSKLQASDKSMCYYFDSQDKIVLAPSSSVIKVVLDYIQKQQIKIYDQVPEIKKFQDKNNEMIGLCKKNNYILKDILGYKVTKEDALMQEGQIMILKREKKQIQTLYQDYVEKRLLTKVKVLKREVLEFYLSREQKEKQSFFFVLYQLKQYCNVEKLLTLMTFFNFKLVKQLKEKVLGLEEMKESWIEKAAKRIYDL